jgi:hypothetical protein
VRCSNPAPGAPTAASAIRAGSGIPCPRSMLTAQRGDF